MVMPGRVQNGVVILENGASLPDGTEVTVSVCAEVDRTKKKHRVQLPLVPANRPGSRRLNAQRVAKILAEDDLSA